MSKLTIQGFLPNKILLFLCFRGVLVCPHEQSKFFWSVKSLTRSFNIAFPLPLSWLVSGESSIFFWLLEYGSYGRHRSGSCKLTCHELIFACLIVSNIVFKLCLWKPYCFHPPCSVRWWSLLWSLLWRGHQRSFCCFKVLHTLTQWFPVSLSALVSSI